MAKKSLCFSLCMIVKDVIGEIDNVLANASVYWDEVVILDTGSTDGTQKYIAEKYPNVKLFEKEFEQFKFCDARNEALSHVTGNVWMWLDSDDTFSHEAATKWREIAQDLLDHPKGEDHVILPYYYKVDEHEVPVVTQYRERIMRGVSKWQWREPIHEVCCTDDPNSKNKAYADYPVVHRPTRRPNESADRNWKILYNSYINGDNSDRNLYYLTRTANVQQNYELAIQYGVQLAERHPGGYYEYEVLKAVGEAYAGLYKKVHDSVLFIKGMDYLTQAIRYDPLRNEARIEKVNLLLCANDPDQALKEALKLNVAMPVTVATLATESYGPFKEALISLIYMKYLNKPYLALRYHMVAMQTAKPSIISYDMEVAIKAYLEENDIGIIYADEALIDAGFKVRDCLRNNGAFHEVWLFTDTACISYARKYYFHLSEQHTTLYKDDCGIRVRKFYMNPHFTAQELAEFKAVGYEECCLLDNKYKSTIETILRCPATIHSSGTTLREMLIEARACRTERLAVVTPLCGGLIAASLAFVLQSYENRGKVTFVTDKEDHLLAVMGWTEDIVSLFVDKLDTVWFADADDFVYWKVANPRSTIEEEHTRDVEPIIITTGIGMAYTGTVAFVAPGIEEWDGTTPYRWGIGASESSVVYLADAMALEGKQVTVFTTCGRAHMVGGVSYVPLKHFDVNNTSLKYDLLIASRYPEALRGPRKAKQQVLWMHDIPESYVDRITDEMVIDKYVCVSDWQKKRAEHANLRKSKLCVIPNGIHPGNEGQPKTYTQGRIVWLSQPERGIDNIYGFWRERPELFKDVWVAYGFYNIQHYNGFTEEAFYGVAYWKQVLRLMGAKILGRVSCLELKQLLDTSDAWVYPSMFYETFCVSAVEAFRSGMRCFCANNGATLETLRLADVNRSGLVMPLESACKESFKYARDSKAWLNMLAMSDIKANKTRVMPKVNDVLYWSNVALRWEQL